MRDRGVVSIPLRQVVAHRVRSYKGVARPQGVARLLSRTGFAPTKHRARHLHWLRNRGRDRSTTQCNVTAEDLSPLAHGALRGSVSV